ncbi:D-glycero-alpha-D-manno-heptose-1,7-bisphosphate 7-phosphatase [Streptomyces abikoensis]|uniref:D-glycero-alpha-D-manno-heptose-1,7-bisphosphate 7-phosphatase n=1 Tax=Streptomyces abikoensis TaxID=97398 RepID=UPI003723DC53
MKAGHAEVRTFFLDRDGTLNAKPPDGRYIMDPAELVLLPGAAEAVRELNANGRRVVLVTNQRGVARGLMTSADLAAVHARLAALLRGRGAFLDAVYVCPHEVGACDCRKPLPGLLKAAMRDFPDIDPADSVMIGDSESDVLAGRAAGTGTVLLQGPGKPPDNTSADLVATDLRTAVGLLLLSSKNGCVSKGGRV